MIGRFAHPGTYRELFETRRLAVCLTGGALALGAWLTDRPGLPGWLPLALAWSSLALNGLPIVIGAAKGLLDREVNVDELVSIAIVASVIQGEVLSAAVVSCIMTLGSLAEERVSDSARRSIKSLVRLTPDTAVRLAGGTEETVPAADLAVGDTVLVRPGERIPVDAVIVSGITEVDESSITGESLPRARREGDAVLAGTLNYSGVIEARAVKVGADTTFGKVVKLVTEAEAGKPRAARVVDRWAAWFTPTVLAVAAAAWWLSGDASRAVAVLIAGCPCALIMAAPTATVAAIGRAAKNGILVKGGQYLEEAARADAVLFDKTGTLTSGEPRVDEVLCCEGAGPEDVVGAAAGAEQGSTHPLARAVLNAARYARVGLVKAEHMLTSIGLGVTAQVAGRPVAVGSVEFCGGEAALSAPLREGLGRIRARGATPLVVCRDEAPIGLLSVCDTVRPSARETVGALRALGIRRLGILSGDHKASVATLADAVGLDAAWSGLKPADKLDILAREQDSGRRVMFVGDGVNDAPALARANVGVAMAAAGTDVALDTADIALVQDDIGRLPLLIGLSRRMLAVIGVNIGLGLTFNTLAILGGGYGILSPIMASLVHNIGSVIVVLSSASLAFVPEAWLLPKKARITCRAKS